MIEVCKKHLRGVCNDALDRYEGANHRIVLQDCVEVLKDFAKRGKKVMHNTVSQCHCRDQIVIALSV